jgi:hypothetical protein
MHASTEALAKVMSHIVGNTDLHARWLNTLSFLEYIGFRKIIKSQDASSMSLETLTHANEEGRHALLLKNLCLKTGGPRYDSYAPSKLLRGAEAELYFQSVDSEAHALLSPLAQGENLTRLTYLAVTWLVEVRALEVYGVYMQALKAAGLSSPLASLLREEEKHLSEVSRNIAGLIPQRTLDDLKAMEFACYQEYMRALVQEVSLTEGYVAHAH